MLAARASKLCAAALSSGSFTYSTVELQFPLLTLSNFPLIDLEGVLGADAGAVSDDHTFDGRRRPVDALWERRVLDLVFGVNLGFGPIVMRALEITQVTTVVAVTADLETAIAIAAGSREETAGPRAGPGAS